MNKTQAQRLLNVATALREAPRSLARKFDMTLYGHNCKTPACAIGHYAFRRDLQRVFRLSRDGRLIFPNGEKTSHSDVTSLRHFGITYDESCELFDDTGCDEAKTPIQAARYIEKFLDRNDWSLEQK